MVTIPFGESLNMMTAIEIKGEITETIETYDPAEWIAWKKRIRTGFPLDPRLAHFVYKQPKYYFGETFYVRKLLGQGFICWQERYQLFQPVKPSSKYYLYSMEIASLMDKKRVRQLHELQGRTPRLANPDIVAFHPEHSRWAFFEVKMPDDNIRANQVHGLAVLK